MTITPASPPAAGPAVPAGWPTGRPTAVLLALAELEALKERIAVLSDSDVTRALASAEAAISGGEGETEHAPTVAMNARLGWQRRHTDRWSLRPCG